MRYLSGFSALISFILLMLAMPLHSVAADEDREETGIKRYGIVHNIAEDRKVEKIGGIYEPEGLDKYIQRRFDDVNGRLSDLQDRLNQIQEQLKNMDQKLQDAGKTTSSKTA